MSFDNHPNAKRVYDYFEKKFSVGYLGIWHLYGVASTHVKNDEHVLSSMIIASAGSYKSQIMKDIGFSYKKYVWRLPDQPTERAIVKEASDNFRVVNNRVWTIDDAVTCFPSLEYSRQTRLVEMFVKLIMDQSYYYSDAFNGRKGINVRMGLYVNVAKETYDVIEEILEKSTFLDRVVPFSYYVDPVMEIRIDRNYRRGIDYGKAPLIKMRDLEVDFPEELDDDFDVLRYRIHNNCKMSLSRASTWLQMILRSIAITEGRNKINKHDMQVFESYLLPHITADRVLPKIVRAILKVLEMNRESSVMDCYEYFNSEVCKSLFPTDYKNFLATSHKDLETYLASAKKILSKDTEVRNMIEKVKIDVI